MENKLREIQHSSASRQRREHLNTKMSKLNSEGFGCESCRGGWCCTFAYNSMQVSPLEALDMYFYLKDHQRIDQSLIDQLRQTQKKFRLDKLIVTKRGEYLRRYYTCPFFEDKAQGCSMGKHHKPYGCLAFNALEKRVEEPGFCESDQSLLSTQIKKNNDELLNDKITELLNLDWEKKDIPSALLDLFDSIQVTDN